MMAAGSGFIFIFIFFWGGAGSGCAPCWRWLLPRAAACSFFFPSSCVHACRIGTIDLACRIGIHQGICCRTTDGSTWKKVQRYTYVLDFHGILCLKDCKGKLLVFGHHGSHWIIGLAVRLVDCVTGHIREGLIVITYWHAAWSFSEKASSLCLAASLFCGAVVRS